MGKIDKEKEADAFWGDTPHHTRDFAERRCAENRARIKQEEEMKGTRHGKD